MDHERDSDFDFPISGSFQLFMYEKCFFLRTLPCLIVKISLSCGCMQNIDFRFFGKKVLN